MKIRSQKAIPIRFLILNGYNASMIFPSDYQYYLPEDLIAQKPAVPRDSSRIFVYDTKTDKIQFDQFKNIDAYLPQNSLFVLNNTKVLPSRITLWRNTDFQSKVKALFLVNEYVASKDETIPFMVDRKTKVGERLYFNTADSIEIVGQDRQIFYGKPSVGKERLFELLYEKGSMPIPLYIKHSPLSETELREKYQTIFAENEGSSAAPTASLHFTDTVFKKIEQKGIEKTYVTLHVGLGTFAPIDEKNISEKKLHEEYYEIPAQTYHYINTMKQEGKEIIAVGTTVVRTLESLKSESRKVESQNAKCIVGKTDLFIYPPYEFKMVDHLITNFHIPGSSLMMLVDAFLGFKGAKRNILDLYKIAVKEQFRFYSFGDAMVIM